MKKKMLKIRDERKFRLWIIFWMISLIPILIGRNIFHLNDFSYLYFIAGIFWLLGMQYLWHSFDEEKEEYA